MFPEFEFCVTLFAVEGISDESCFQVSNYEEV